MIAKRPEGISLRRNGCEFPVDAHAKEELAIPQPQGIALLIAALGQDDTVARLRLDFTGDRQRFVRNLRCEADDWAAHGTAIRPGLPGFGQAGDEVRARPAARSFISVGSASRS